MQGTLKINTEKLLPIIKKWLYSEKDIFLRELISNSCDALSKVKVLSEKKELEADPSAFRIDVTVDKQSKTLIIKDNGIGMTAEEVEKYIAQLAFSGAEEFINKYEESDQVIGHFGLGFYSAYMVASKVEIDTLSFQEGAEAAFWSCDGGVSYDLDKGSRTERGTTITLHLEEEEYLDETKIRTILTKYCSFLPYPIYLGEEQINHKEPLYLKSPADCKDEEYLEFYRQLHPFEPDPIFWVHLNVDYPYNLKGILYFPKVDGGFDFQKHPTKLFCNRVFVSENCEGLLPDYLTILRGAIDSPDIPLNVSRSYLQMDGTVRSVATHIAKKVADRLATLYQSDRESFTKYWSDVETIIKLGVIQDEKFYERIKDFLIWQDLSGDWVSLTDHLGDKPEKVFYTQDETAPFLTLYKEKNVPVLVAKSPLDPPLMNFLETKIAPTTFQRIDGGVDEAILEKDQKGSTEIATFVKETLGIEGIEVEAQGLSSKSLPAFIMLDETMRRMRETLALSDRERARALMSKKTFVVNTNSPIIEKLAKQEDKELAKEMLTHLYQLALLGQKELPLDEYTDFIERSQRVLEKLFQE